MALGGLYFLVIPVLVYVFRGELSVEDSGPLPGVRPEFALIGLASDDILVMIKVLFFVALFHGILLIYQINSARVLEKKYEVASVQSAWRRSVFSFGALLISYGLFCLFVLKDATHWNEARVHFFEKFGQAGVVFIFILFALKMVFISDIFHVFARRFKSGPLVFKMVALIMILELLVTGNRISLLLCFVVFFAACIDRKSYKLILYWSILGAFLGVLLSGYGIFRSLQHSYGISYAGAALWKQLLNAEDVIFFVMKGVFETVNLNILFSVTKVIPTFEINLENFTFLKPFYSFVPRSIMPDKVETVTVIAGKMFSDVPDISLVTLLYGEGYLNFGGFYPILIFPFVILLNLIVLIGKSFTSYRYLSLLVGFLVIRFPYSDVFIQASLAVIIAFLFSSLKVRRGI